jgi:hypothetical protein
VKHNNPPSDRQVSLVLTNGDSFADAERDTPDASLLVLSISRREVERGQIGDVVDRLLQLTDSLERLKRYKDKLLLSFDGYDQDERELYEIPEVVRFFEKVNEHWPYWVHFCWKTPSAALTPMLLLLCPLVERRNGQRLGVRLRDPYDLSRVLLQMFEGLNTLYGVYGLGPDENSAMSERWLEVVSEALNT